MQNTGFSGGRITSSPQKRRYFILIERTANVHFSLLSCCDTMLKAIRHVTRKVERFMTSESKLRGELAICLRREFPGAIVFCHEDEFTIGILDISFTWAGNKFQGTTWLELKHVTPKKQFHSSDLQKQTAVELASFTQSWYIVYEERVIGQDLDETDIIGKMTYIIHPALCNGWRTGQAGDGFNHYFIAEFLREAYG